MLSLAVRSRRLATVALVLFALGGAPAAHATAITVDGGWSLFQWTGGAGAIDTPADGFQFTSASSVIVQITDSSLIGDLFQIFVNGASVATSSATNPGEFGFPSGAFNGPAAWADARLSKVALALGPGSYDIDIVVTTSVGSTGGGFIQVLSVVPEPRMLALLALGCVALLGFARQASARPSLAKR